MFVCVMKIESPNVNVYICEMAIKTSKGKCEAKSRQEKNSKA